MAAAPAAGRAESAPAAPSSLAPEKLNLVGDYIRNEIAGGKIPRRHPPDPAAWQAGLLRKFRRARRRETQLPMTADTIFRLYSMSKADHLGCRDDAGGRRPAAARGSRLEIHSGLWPTPKSASRGGKKPGQAPALAGSNRSIARSRSRTCCATPRASPTASMATGEVRKLYANAGLFDRDIDNTEFVARIAQLPFAEQPGTLWSTAIPPTCSAASSRSYRESPCISSKESACSIRSASTRRRFTSPTKPSEPVSPSRCRTTASGSARPPWCKIRCSRGRRRIRRRRAWSAPSATTRALPQMLLNGGTLDGGRYLKAETIALMASDHIGPETGIARDQLYYPGATSGFGLGFAVRTSVPPHTTWPLGEYRWDGVAGTFFFIEPGGRSVRHLHGADAVAARADSAAAENADLSGAGKGTAQGLIALSSCDMLLPSLHSFLRVAGRGGGVRGAAQAYNRCGGPSR